MSEEPSKFTVGHFITKFEAIPEEKWATGDYVNYVDPTCRCALGHCGWGSDTSNFVTTAEGDTLNKILPRTRNLFAAAAINDGKNPLYQQSTPKQRILAALRDVQEKEINHAALPI